MKAVAAALVGVVLAATPSLAADLFGAAPQPTFEAPEPPMVEVGANWYLRGDVGLSFDQAASFSLAGVQTPTGPGVQPFDGKVGSSNDHDDFAADIGVGYRFNNYVRGELTYDYRVGPSGGNSNTVVCPYGLNAVGASGYLFNTANTCDGNFSLQQHNQTGLANVYFDLGHYWGFTPYVGAGAGVNANTTSGSVAYTTTVGGAPYAASLATTGTVPQVWVNPNGTAVSPQPGVPFSQQAWNRSFSNTKYSMAWAVMAGVGIQLSPSATLDIGYRYLDAGTTTTSITPQTGAVVKQSNTSQEIRIGIRYMAD